MALKLLPIVAILVFGAVLRRAGVLGKNDGDVFLKLIFYAAIPAMILLSVPEIDLRAELLHLPLIAVVIFLVNYFLARRAALLLGLPDQQRGPFVIAGMVMNTSFVFPFLLLGQGKEAFAHAVIFDFGNAVLIFTFARKFAAGCSDEAAGRSSLSLMASCPPLWALAAAVLLNASGLVLPQCLKNTLEPIGQMVTPLTMLALGIHFTPRIIQMGTVASALCIRMGAGFFLGLGACLVLGIEGTERAVVCSCAAAPSGYFTLIYSSLHELDTELAASLVSAAIAAGAIVVPLIIMFLGS